MKINYVVGNAIEPIGDSNKLVVHCCNALGFMGAGIAAAIRQKWPHVYKDYSKFCKKSEDYPSCLLGEVQFVKAEDGIVIANIIGQNDCGPTIIGDVSIPPVDYRALEVGFAKIKKSIIEGQRKSPDAKVVTIHMPRIGCGLAGGEWGFIELILDSVFGNTNWEITVYDLK